MAHFTGNISLNSSLLLEMFDNLPSLAWVAKPDGYVYWYNKRWYEYTGTKPEETLGWGWELVHDPEVLPKVVKRWKEFVKIGKPGEMTFSIKGADGAFRPFLTRIEPLKNSRGKIQHWVGTCTDITEMVKTENALRESQDRFQAVFENAPIGITHVDPSGKWIMVNQRLCDFLGYTKDEIRKLTFRDITHPEDLAIDLGNMEKMRQGTLDGYTREKRYIRKDKEVVWASFSGTLVREDDGSIKYFIAIVEDITEVKKAQEEQHKLQRISQERNQLLRINRAKDEFMSIVSHQLRTPATAVKQYIGMLLSGFSGALTQEQKRYLQIADESNNRQLQLVNDLLKTAQIDDATYRLQRRATNLTSLVRETVSAEEPVLKMRGQKLISRGLKKDVIIEIDPIEIKLAISNLLENASKYSGPDQIIHIELHCSAKYVNISVEDHGAGIDKASQSEIFDKFTRVDNEFSDTVTGTGLGLYWVKQIIELHGGRINVKSKLKEGSKFTIKLPI